MLFISKVFRYTALLLIVMVTLPATAGTGDGLDTELKLVYRAQAPDGSVAFDGLARFYGFYPVSASFCLDEHRRAPNAALVSRAAAAITRYYDYLFGNLDRDRDLLVETTVYDQSGRPIEIEDTAFNSLLALDMMSLAQLELEIRRPYRALYWYYGSRLVQDAVIQAGHDADAGFFFPTSVTDEMPVKRYHALSAAPLLFPGRIGENHAASVIRQYVLKPVARVPESPFDVLGGAAQPWSDDATTCGRLLKTVVMLEILESRGFDTDAATFRAQALQTAVDELAAMPGEASAHHRHLIDLLESGHAGSLGRSTTALDLFLALVRSTDLFEDADYVRLESAIADTRRWIAISDDEFGTTELNASGRVLRTVYSAVSAARERALEKSLLPSESYRAVGTDPMPALLTVLDDVVALAGEVDNHVFRRRYRGAGLYVTPTMLQERAIAGGTVEVKWVIGVHNAPLTIHTARVDADNEVFELIKEGAPLTLSPGAPQALTFRMTVDRDRVNTLHAVPMTLTLETGDDVQSRFHALRSVYVQNPVEVAVGFDRGRMLDGESLPVNVVIRKRMEIPAVVGYEWYSPTGLRVAEGRSGEYTMPADQDSVTLPLNVVIPSPCRPGRFPFKIKFTANGNDLGIISSSFFKPYEWVFAGPFDAAGNAMAATYPPQNGVRVDDTYKTSRGSVSWRIVGDDAYSGDGDIVLRNLMNGSGVAFLHTVVETESETSLPVVMSATSPAELFVNGEPVLRVGDSDTPAPGYARAELTRGTNSFLVKVAGGKGARLSFNLGDENNEASYMFNNNLAEILDGYSTLLRRSRGQEDKPRESQKLVTLRYEDPTARTVAVIGTFNGWSPERSPMRAVSVGTWEIVLSLPPGKYSYRFVVDNRDQVLDPRNDAVEPDGFGGKNSVIVVE